MIIINEIKIYYISNKKFLNLINLWKNHKYIDRKLFMTEKDNQYICLDNESGLCFIEKFDTKNQAICWLIRTDYAAFEIEKLKNIEIKKLLKKHNYKIIYAKNKKEDCSNE